MRRKELNAWLDAQHLLARFMRETSEKDLAQVERLEAIVRDAVEKNRKLQRQNHFAERMKAGYAL